MPSASELLARAGTTTRGFWLDTHPLREQIIECVKADVSLIGLARELTQLGHPVTKGQLKYVRDKIGEGKL